MDHLTSKAYKRCLRIACMKHHANLEMTATVSARAATSRSIISSTKKSPEPSPTPCHWNGADEWQMNSHHRRAREGRILLDLHERVRNDAVLQLTTVEIEDILQQVLGIVSSNSKLRHEVSVGEWAFCRPLTLLVGNHTDACFVSGDTASSLGIVMLGIRPSFTKMLQEETPSVFLSWTAG